MVVRDLYKQLFLGRSTNQIASIIKNTLDYEVIANEAKTINTKSIGGYRYGVLSVIMEIVQPKDYKEVFQNMLNNCLIREDGKIIMDAMYYLADNESKFMDHYIEFLINNLIENIKDDLFTYKMDGSDKIHNIENYISGVYWLITWVIYDKRYIPDNRIRICALLIQINNNKQLFEILDELYDRDHVMELIEILALTPSSTSSNRF